MFLMTWSFVEHDPSWSVDQHFDSIVMSAGLATDAGILVYRDRP